MEMNRTEGDFVPTRAIVLSDHFRFSSRFPVLPYKRGLGRGRFRTRNLWEQEHVEVLALAEMGSKGVIHVFIGAPVITPLLPCGVERSGADGKAVWKDMPYAYNTQGACMQDGRGHHISADEELKEDSGTQTKHAEPVYDGHSGLQGSFGRTCLQGKMDAHDLGIISDLVSSTELCHITHLQQPSAKESGGLCDYIGEDQDPHVIQSVVCHSISAETEFLTILTSSQLAIGSPESDATKATNDPIACTSEYEKQGVLVENTVIKSASQEGFTCSSDLFTDTSDDDLDYKSFKCLKSDDVLDQRSLQSHKSGEKLDQIEELDQKAMQSQKSDEELYLKLRQSQKSVKTFDQMSLKSQRKGEDLDQKSVQSQKSVKTFDQMSSKSQRKCEDLDQNSIQSQKSGKKLEQEAFPSHKTEKDLLHIQGESATELNNNVDHLGGSNSKRKKTLSVISPSKHEQQSKKSKPSISPVKYNMNRCNRHWQQTPAKSLTLLKHCSDKNKEYNIMVVVLQPCHLKEIKVKSGPNIGSTLPLATVVVMDQSEIKREVVMWRTAAFWSLALLPGEIIVLTNVSVCEDRWREDIVLQSSFRSKLTNLGSCSTLLSGENSRPIEFSAVKELLNFIHRRHPYLSELSPRQPQRLDQIQYVSLAELQPELLLHSMLKVNSISVLKESTYYFKGLQQNKIILTVEQVKGSTSTLVLWGTCVSWCDQIHLKRDHIWVFKYLFCKKNIMSMDLELHTTPWSSCECLFDDDQRAVDFRKRYSIPSVKQMSLVTMLEDRYSGEIQVKGRILQMEFHIQGKHKILINHRTSLLDILKFLPDVVYTGCGKCKRELTVDENNVYEQCYACLPFNQIRAFYRPAQMTIMSDDSCVRIQVPPDILENVLLNIAPSLLPKVFPSSTDVTYGTIVADLCHSLVAQTGESFVFTITSQFILDENSMPLEEDFHLLDFHINL